MWHELERVPDAGQAGVQEPVPELIEVQAQEPVPVAALGLVPGVGSRSGRPSGPGHPGLPAGQAHPQP